MAFDFHPHDKLGILWVLVPGDVLSANVIRVIGFSPFLWWVSNVTDSFFFWCSHNILSFARFMWRIFALVEGDALKGVIGEINVTSDCKDAAMCLCLTQQLNLVLSVGGEVTTIVHLMGVNVTVITSPLNSNYYAHCRQSWCCNQWWDVPTPAGHHCCHPMTSDGLSGLKSTCGWEALLQLFPMPWYSRCGKIYAETPTQQLTLLSLDPLPWKQQAQEQSMAKNTLVWMCLSMLSWRLVLSTNWNEP